MSYNIFQSEEMHSDSKNCLADSGIRTSFGNIYLEMVKNFTKEKSSEELNQLLDKAYTYYMEDLNSIKFSNNSNKSENEAIILNNIAAIHEIKKDNKEAHKNYLKSLNILNQTSNGSINNAILQYNLASLLLKNNMFNEASEFVNNSHEILTIQSVKKSTIFSKTIDLLINLAKESNKSKINENGDTYENNDEVVGRSSFDNRISDIVQSDEIRNFKRSSTQENESFEPKQKRVRISDLEIDDKYCSISDLTTVGLTPSSVCSANCFWENISKSTFDSPINLNSTNISGIRNGNDEEINQDSVTITNSRKNIKNFTNLADKNSKDQGRSL